MSAADPGLLRDIEHLKADIPISSVIGETVTLRRRQREFEALCPFHAERTPSFTVVDDQLFFHCFGCGAHGDLFDWLRRARNMPLPEAVAYLAGKEIEPPARLPSAFRFEPEPDPDQWRYPWQGALPVAGTEAEVYLARRRLRFDDPAGRVLRFARRRARRSPAGQLERHPALLFALSDIKSGEQCGIINVYLKPDGSDRLRDKKGKTVTGRAAGATVMLSGFDEPTIGLVVCEGCETGIALFQWELRPIWACGGAGTLAKLPLIGGIEALTIAADADAAGQRASDELEKRWRHAGREVLSIAPPVGDWADAQ